MYILIDRTNLRFLNRHHSYATLQTLAYLQYPNVEAIIVPLARNGDFSQFERSDLETIYANCYPGYTLPANMLYSDMLTTMRQIAAECIPLTPLDDKELNRQARLIERDDPRPYAYTPGASSPTMLSQFFVPSRPDWDGKRPLWPTPDQLDVRTEHPLNTSQSTDSHSVGSLPPLPASGFPTPSTTEDEIMAKNDATAKKAAKKVPAKKAAAPAKTAAKAAAKAKPALAPPKAAATKAAKTPVARVPKADGEAAPATRGRKPSNRPEQNGVRRPAGAITGFVWDTLDNLSKKLKRPPTIQELRDEVASKQLNPNMLQAQYASWKRFNGVTGRVKTA